MSGAVAGAGSYYRGSGNGANGGGYFGNGGGYTNQYSGMGGGRAPRLQTSNSFSSAASPKLETVLSSTNLYIRGLSPTTTDEELRSMCQEFGKISSTKAIMDKTTNQCKGYGFVDFETQEAASAAVDGLQARGIQAQMAKARSQNSLEEWRSLQQQEQDPTNLYIANLPLSYNETQLESTLNEYGMVISTRILRNADGQSRGVGFARMDNKEKCEDIIRALNGTVLPGSPEGAAPLLVKLADSGHRKKRQQMGMSLMGNPMMDYGGPSFPASDIYSRAMQSGAIPYMMNSPFMLTNQHGYQQYAFDNVSAIANQMSNLSMGGGAGGNGAAAANGTGPERKFSDYGESANGQGIHPMYAAAAMQYYPTNAAQYYAGAMDNSATSYAAAATANHYGSNHSYGHNSNATDNHEPMGTFVAPNTNGTSGSSRAAAKYGVKQ